MLEREWCKDRRQLHTAIALLRMDIINFSFHHPQKLVKLDDLIAPERSETLPAKRHRMTQKRRAALADGLRRYFQLLSQ